MSSQHEIALEVGCYDMCFQTHAILTLQETVEGYIWLGSWKTANLCAIHKKCITIMPKDIQLAWCIYRENLHY